MFVPTSKACEILGVHPNTLRKWADSGKIKSIRVNGKRQYDCSQVLGACMTAQRNYCYCRVADESQMDDLKEMSSKLQREHPDFVMITEIGSGMDFNRDKLRVLLSDCMDRKVCSIAVISKEHLSEVGFDLLQWLFDKFSVTLITHPELESNKNREALTNLLKMLRELERQSV